MADTIYWIDKDGNEGCMELEGDPQPQHPLIRVARWIPVHCPECGKTLCEAQSGSVVKIVCKRCKQERTLIAA